MTTHPARGFGYWSLKVFAVALALFGLAMAAGGLWLVALGGSWYYLPAGIGILASGAMLFLLRIQGVWLYWLVFLATLAWALWEVGAQPWPLVPRLVAPTVIALLTLLYVPTLRRHSK
ncbi:glucose dehydrogenase [Pseudomonas stutzeri]|uniref:Glucose dehydrogenase n=1 Tax=Stutzerimonas stutzeri TaxID=316 RepID=A0A2N8S4F0_STUST|nr:glucose dehydrogenase [Stutzerimonas stutzeri]MCQ4294093.1 glucose dehydrogenase [Stutzerimonas stutzeri]PNF81514.1 glucose dehydrogenase [Stutzerimonas stutzeri]